MQHVISVASCVCAGCACLVDAVSQGVSEQVRQFNCCVRLGGRGSHRGSAGIVAICHKALTSRLFEHKREVTFQHI